MTAPTLYDSLLPHQQRALLEKYRYVETYHDDWADCVIENDIANAATLLGIEISRPLWDINEWDGFRFVGSYTYEPLAHLLVLSEYPQDKQIHKIAWHLHFAQPLPYTVSAKVSVGGYRGDFATNTIVELGGPHSPYPHDDPDQDDYPADWAHLEQRVTEALQDFMRWAFKQIQAEYDYYTSDEAVIEFINDRLTLEDIEGAEESELQEAA